MSLPERANQSNTVDTVILKVGKLPTDSWLRLIHSGKNYKPTGRKIGNPHLKWAFSEAITLLKRECPRAKAFPERIEATPRRFAA